MRLCFCGKSFSGKSEQAYLIADRYSLKAINTEAMLSEAIDVYAEWIDMCEDVNAKRPRVEEEEADYE